MSDHAKPIPLALIVCDHITTCPETKKRSLLGLFDRKAFAEYPTPVFNFCVFCSVTEYTGKVPLALRIVDREEERPPVYEHAMQLPAEMNPLFTIDCEFRIDKATFPVPGDYRVQLLAEGVAILERKLKLFQPPKINVKPNPPRR
jgi:hypothetical protein